MRMKEKKMEINEYQKQRDHKIWKKKKKKKQNINGGKITFMLCHK